MFARISAALGVSALVLTTLLAPLGPPAAAGTRDHLKLQLQNTADGRVLVTWEKSPIARVTSYVVVTSTARSMRTDTWRSARIPASAAARLVVDHSTAVTPASGDYTFVKVLVFQGDTRSGESPAKWIMPSPIEPPAAATRVNVATFNVVVWGKNEPRRAATSWVSRRGRVVDSIVASRAGVVLLQEASGAPKNGPAGRLWQYQDLARRLPDRYRLTRRAPYTGRDGRINGSQGSRIIYDSSKYRELQDGYLHFPQKSAGHTRWVPWALLEDRATGDQFYALSTHFASGADKPGSTVLFRLRQRQVRVVIAAIQRLASSGRAVYLGGDFNSTSNTLPYNGVHRALVLAGFYDGFSSTDVAGGQYPTTNGYRFPVKPAAYRRDYVMSYNAPAGSYAFVNHAYQSMTQVTSDHFMQSTVLPARPGPYQAPVAP